MPPKYTPTSDDVIPSGLCECGCGKATSIVKGTDRKAGKFAGYPHRYIKGHFNKRIPPPENVPTGICECGCGLPTKMVRAKDADHTKRHYGGYPYPYRRGHGGKPMGDAHHLWRGGKQRRRQGYVYTYAPDHPNAVDRYVLEHRLVMEKHLGRLLTKDESVHHKNGVRDDNRIENLQLRRRYHGYGQAYKCADCGSHNVIPDDLD